MAAKKSDSNCDTLPAAPDLRPLRAHDNPVTKEVIYAT